MFRPRLETDVHSGMLGANGLISSLIGVSHVVVVPVNVLINSLSLGSTISSPNMLDCSVGNGCLSPSLSSPSAPEVSDLTRPLINLRSHTHPSQLLSSFCFPIPQPKLSGLQKMKRSSSSNVSVQTTKVSNKKSGRKNKLGKPLEIHTLSVALSNCIIQQRLR